MTMFLANLLLAMVWAALTGVFSLRNMATGFVIAYLVLYAASPVMKPTLYFQRLRRLPVFALYFAWLVIVANVKVARTVLSPGMKLQPGIIAVPLSVEKDSLVVLLANLVTLTPGTLSMEISRDRRTLYVHALDASDPDAVRRDIKITLEQKIQELLS
ncbi:MAG TPA: Na+/H+ antiporter subunit E [Verrucomicrobia bacterium]|nr:MAG: cation:proton antiporter [Lentisphaerae bacterium GWF2_57_35]HBA84441.1 Na+/H+ antiporter subunit E [Verrucomicrobiota bacterium]